MKLDLVCLGVGKGATYVMQGKPSSSFAIRVDEQPILLVDCGAGIALACQKYLGGIIPKTIYISHNHMDHAGDLPILLTLISQQNRNKIRIVGHSTVLSIVKQHRLHELIANGVSLDTMADWVESNEQGFIQIGDNLSIQVFKSVHSYVCYGFVLKYECMPILGYTADSGYSERIYSLVTQASVAIVDGREMGNTDHASFEEIERFAKGVPDCSYWVIHYEQTNYNFTPSNVKLLIEGQIVPLSPR